MIALCFIAGGYLLLIYCGFGLVRAETRIMQIHMHYTSIQQDRVSSEDLLVDVACRYEWPKKRLVRVYAKGVEPTYPNRFKFAVNASVRDDGGCEIQALANPDNLVIGDMKALFRHMTNFGAKYLWWLDDGKVCRYPK